MKRRRTAFGILALTLGSLIPQLVSADPLPNAWQISDNSGATGSTLSYTTNLSIGQHMVATNLGWRYSVHARFVTDFGDSATLNMSYGLGDRRFLIWWDLDGDTNLTAELDGGPTFTLTADGTGAALYHTHEIVYNPTNGTASYLFDGVVKTNNWQSSDNDSPAGRISWGAGSSAGQGQVNFNRVMFQITNTTVASYDAGTVTNPPVQPDPQAQGWTANPGAVGAVTNFVFPDTTLLPVAVTQPADQFTPEGARLNGQVDPNGSPTTAWFEWGADTNYGLVTTSQVVGSGLNPLNHSAVLGGLVHGLEYHYRLVVSNAFGVIDGTDQSFSIPDFLLVSIPGLPAISDSSVVWGDSNNDGQLDFILTGSSSTGRVSQLWRNTSAGFTNVPINGLPGVGGVGSGDSSERSVAWGDLDGDGWLDFLLTGTTNGNANGAIAQIWRNTGAGFSNVTSAMAPGLPGVYDSSVAWGDFDGDGRLDFLLTGDSSTESVSQLWRNTGNSFVNVPLPPDLPKVGDSAVGWGDYDNDGRLDFLITGTTNGLSTGAISQLWRNTSDGFSNVNSIIASGLARVRNSSVAWGDYDNDGKLDFVLTGLSSSGRVSQLWRNTSSGFNNLPVPNLPGAGGSSVAWGDFDNDGRLDFLLAGTTNGSDSGSFCQVLRNTGNGFTNVFLPGVPAVRDASVTWGDYDNDGRLDFLISGLSSTGRVCQLWRNNMPSSNAPPTAPVGLSATVSVNTITLNWSAAADDHTPISGLNYNLRIGTTPGGSDVLSPMALTNGRRLLPTLGNAQAATSVIYHLNHLPPSQVCYWSVQAVDAGFAGSPFAAELQFFVDPVTAEIEAKSVLFGLPPWTIQFIGHASGGLRDISTTDDQSGSITAQGQNLPNEGAAKAFDNTLTNKWLDFANAFPLTRSSWIQYRYPGGQAHTVTRYTITSANDEPRRDPRDWKLLGSNDGGTTWTILDTRTNETFATRFLTRSFSVANAEAYNIYRFTNDTVLNIPGPANSVQLAELEFFGDYHAYSWDFGDGTTSNAQSPQHTYPSNGIYTVTLIVTDGISTVTNTLSVNTGDPRFDNRPQLQQPIRLGNGVFQFAFSNVGAATVVVLGTTNLALPVGQWELLGLPIPLGGGLYQFNDGLAPNYAQRFYLLRKQ